MANSKKVQAAAAVAVLTALGCWWWVTQSDGPIASAASVRTSASGVAAADASTLEDDRREAKASSIATSATDRPSRRQPDTAPARADAPHAVASLVSDDRPASARDCAVSAVKHDCDFLEPDPLVLDEMAACGIVRYDFPAMFAQADWTPEFEAQWLDLVGASGDEREKLIRIGDAYRDELFGELEALAREVGVEPWPTDVTLLTAVVDISKAVGDDAVAAASRVVAQERAGHADPPEPSADRPVAERFVRLFTHVGDGFEDAVARELGDARARELHLAQDGWPGLRHQTGARCPE